MKLYAVAATCEIPEVVARCCQGNALENKIVFCEDKFTLALELAIAKKGGGSFGTNVFSFNRYMHKYLPVNKKVLSPEACALAVKGILLDNKAKLTCFKNVYDPNLASVVYELIAQLKSARVTPDDILRAKQEATGNLLRKLSDVYLIFSEYESFVKKNNLTDGNNRLSALPEYISGDQKIAESDVIIAGFPSLNRTLCEIFKALYKRAKSLTFVVAAGSNANVYTNESFNFALQQFAPEVIWEKTGEERARLLGGLFCPSALAKEGRYSSKVRLYSAKTPEDEIRHAAKIIKKEVIGGKRYADFAVCAENIEGYELIVKRVFDDYGIPYFFDSSKNLGKHPLTRLICSYFDVVRRGFSVDDFLAFVKNPLFTPDKGEADRFENYLIKNAATRKTVRSPFFMEDENREQLEQLRKRAIEVCAFIEGEQTVEQVLEGVKRMLDAVDAQSNCRLLSDELRSNGMDLIADFNDQAWGKLEGVISDVQSLLGEKRMPLEGVKNLFLSGMTACSVALIPKFKDNVLVGDFRSVRYDGAKVVFAVGLNDGVPSTKIDSALLCDRDIAKMEKASVIVEPKIKEVNRRAREAACMAIASFEDVLHLSYSAKGAQGERSMPSEIINYVKAIFSDLGRKTAVYSEDDYAELARELGGDRYREYQAMEYATQRSSVFCFARDVSGYREGFYGDFDAATAYYKVVDGDMKEACDGVLGLVNAEVASYQTPGASYAGSGLSATAIEGYFACPYANFIQKGVKLKEREQRTIRANDLGTMIHDIGERFVKGFDWSKDEDAAVSFCNQCFDEVLQKEEYARFAKPAGGKKTFELIRREAVRFCLDTYRGCVHSALKPKYIEVEFGLNGKKPIWVKTRNGNMRVSGKVDRIDVSPDGKFMRVVDYKTGFVDDKNEESLLYSGNKLQLYLYAKAFSRQHEPIGAYYMPVADGFAKKNQSTVMTMVGKTSDQIEKASLIDDSITAAQPKGVYVKASLERSKKDGRLKNASSLLSQREFEAFMDYAEAITGEGLAQMSEGVIIASPYEDKCTYCGYRGLCGYDESVEYATRSCEGASKASILRAMGIEADDVKESEELNEGGES